MNRLALLACTLLLLLAGCHRAPDSVQGRWSLPLAERVGDPFPRAFLDRYGNRIDIPRPPRRIASATVFTDAVLLDICDEKRVVALSAKSTEPEFSPVAERSQRFKNHITADPESILWVDPDLVFLSSFSDSATLRLASGKHRKVVRLHGFSSVANITGNIRAVGYLLGEDENAEACARKMEMALLRIQRRHGGQGPVWRVCSWSGGYVAGRNTIFDSLLSYVGARNVAADQGITGHKGVAAERILDWNPDALVVGTKPGGEEAIRKLIKQSAALCLLPAVKKDRIVFVPNALLLSTSHHLVGAAEAIARQLDEWGKP